MGIDVHVREADRPEGRRTGLPDARELGSMAMVSAVLAIVCVMWVGETTVFSAEVVSLRDGLHEALLTNTPPGGGTWSDIGANGINVRAVLVHAVDRVARISGQSIHMIYQLLDLASLWAALIVVFLLLRSLYSFPRAALGTVLLGGLLPLSMFLHFFHPWDKPTFLLISLALLTAVHRQRVAFLVILVLAVVVKYDSLLFGLAPIALARSGREGIRDVVFGVLCLVIGVATWKGLQLAFPGGDAPRDVLEQLSRNVGVVADLGIRYPPLLAQGLLLGLGALGWPWADGVAKRLALLGLVIMVPHVLFTNVAEVRAQLGVLICLLPLATSLLARPERGGRAA